MNVRPQMIDLDAELQKLLDLWLREEQEWEIIKEYVRDHMFVKGMDWSRIDKELDEIEQRVLRAELPSFAETIGAIMGVIIPAWEPASPTGSPK